MTIPIAEVAARFGQSVREAMPISPECRAMVFTSRTSGLANRLRALVAYQALSQMLEVDFYVDWVPDAPCDERPETLIELGDFNFIDDATFQTLRQRKDVSVVSRSVWFDIAWQAYLVGRFSWPDYARRVQACLERLRPCGDIEAEVDAFSARHAFNRWCGVHIRQTDNVGAYPSWEKNAPAFRTDRISRVDGFAEFIAHSTDRVFLSTDNPEVERLILAQAGDRVVVFPKAYREPLAKVRIRTSSIREALVEMLLLGRCRRVVGTYFSSFSIFSALWAGIEYHEMRGCTVTSNDMVREFREASGARTVCSS
jgi:hypothetical protein